MRFLAIPYFQARIEPILAALCSAALLTHDILAFRQHMLTMPRRRRT
jgi:hypothetical protein